MRRACTWLGGFTWRSWHACTCWPLYTFTHQKQTHLYACAPSSGNSIFQCDRKTARGDEVSTHYTGWLRQNGVVFDSSVSRGVPYTFTLGNGQVIQGWENGLLAMCVGERRRLTVPSDLGYGALGSGTSIPPGATLVYDIELVRIKGPDGKEEL